MIGLPKYICWWLISFATIASHAQEEQPMIGQPAPSFELKDLNGSNFSLQQLKGKLIVIHFAATWCPFCNAEAPNLELLHRSYKDKGVQVLLIDVKENQQLVAQSAGRLGFSFPVLLDSSGTVAAAYAPAGVLPDLAREEVPIASNLIIDKEGKIRFYSLLNTASFDARLTKLRTRLDQLLSQPTVSASADSIFARPGQTAVSMIRVSVKEGYHIQADKVSDTSLVPVRLKIIQDAPFTTGNALFPSYKLFHLEGTEQDLNVFDSLFIIRLPIKTPPSTQPGRYQIKAQLYYQACNTKTCLFPRSLDLDLPIVVLNPRHPM